MQQPERVLRGPRLGALLRAAAGGAGGGLGRLDPDGAGRAPQQVVEDGVEHDEQVEVDAGGLGEAPDLLGLVVAAEAVQRRPREQLHRLAHDGRREQQRQELVEEVLYRPHALPEVLR